MITEKMIAAAMRKAPMLTALDVKSILKAGLGALAKELAGRDKWRTMESAPRDGTDILICKTKNNGAYNISIARYLHINAYAGFFAGGLICDPDPIAWMPLPSQDSTAGVIQRYHARNQKEYKAEQADLAAKVAQLTGNSHAKN